MRSGSNSSSPRWATASEFKRPTPSIQIYTRLGDAKIDGDVKGVPRRTTEGRGICRRAGLAVSCVHPPITHSDPIAAVTVRFQQGGGGVGACTTEWLTPVATDRVVVNWDR
jgi:hypothetical protein